MNAENNGLPPGSHGIVIVNGEDCTVDSSTTRNMDNHVTILGGKRTKVKNHDARNSPEWEERRRRGKTLGIIGTIVASVVAGGIVHYLGWA